MINNLVVHDDAEILKNVIIQFLNGHGLVNDAMFHNFGLQQYVT